MEAINKLEQDASGTAIYSPFIQRIKSNDAYVQTSTLNNAFEDPTLKSKIQFVSPRVKQGNTLSAAQLKEINPNLQVGGLLLTMVDERTNLSKNISQGYRKPLLML